VPATTETRLEGVHCTITVDAPASSVVLVIIEGTDVGELGDAPFQAVEARLTSDRKVELFIDARRARGPSIDVSNEWAQWLARHRDALLHASMLTGNRLVGVTADFVRRFADLGDLMRIYDDPSVFDGALWDAVQNARDRRDA